VTAEKLRFDFSSQVGLNIEKIEKVDSICNDIIKKQLIIYKQEVSLDPAKKIKGVRKMFTEAYPDPVRVVSIGADINECLLSPDDDKWADFSIEFCGGTHLSNSKEIELYCTVYEESMGQGEFRIHGVTGDDAKKAIIDGDNLFQRVKDLLNTDDSKLQQEYQVLKTLIDSSIIPYIKKVEIRNYCEKNILPKIASIAKTDIKQKQQESGNASQQILDELKQNEKQQVVVKFLPEVKGSNKILSDTAVALLEKCEKEIGRDIAIMFLSIEPKSNNLIIQANVPSSLVSKGLKASEWVKESIPGAKCGPKADVAQGKRTNSENIENLVQNSLNWANTKLNQ